METPVDFKMTANVGGSLSVAEAKAIASARAEARALDYRARVARANDQPDRAELDRAVAERVRQLAEQAAERLAGKVGQRESDKPAEGVRDWRDQQLLVTPTVPDDRFTKGGNSSPPPPKPCACEEGGKPAAAPAADDDDEPWRTLAVLALATIAGHLVGRVVGAIAR